MSILDASNPPLNHRERFRRLMYLRAVDRWHEEGLSAGWWGRD